MALVQIKGKGNLYWAREYGADGRFVDTAWMHETSPPFRSGKALRVRFGTRAFHLGVCWKNKNPIVRETDKTPEEIREWVS